MKYFAFISYTRSDTGIAFWLHNKLEKYPYPTNMVSNENRPLHNKFVRKIFIDMKDLPVASHEFTEDIKHSLEESRYLIVICSKKSVRSEFVQKEIDYFLVTHQYRAELILPVFVDQIDGCLPSALSGIDILKRICPIYNTKLNEKSEANLYCFYHVASFLLKVDFTKLYNRYETYSKRKRSYKIKLSLAFMILFIFSTAFLYISLNRQLKLTEKQRELTEFEKNIFPLSVVYGYENNFLSPTIDYLKKQNSSFGIYILMPYSLKDLKHQNRIAKVGYCMEKQLQADSIYSYKLPTKMKRSTIIGRIASDDDRYKSVYIDFASTTSSFLKILNYKKQRYADLNENEVIQDYTNTFIRQTKELLKEDSVYVHFYVSVDDFINAIRKVGMESL